MKEEMLDIHTGINKRKEHEKFLTKKIAFLEGIIEGLLKNG